ncbi:MAG: peptidylprolyl isomerase, partial [Deltaproteobacteria bacterium]
MILRRVSLGVRLCATVCATSIALGPLVSYAAQPTPAAGPAPASAPA